MPREVLVAHTVAQVRAVLQAVDAMARQGRWCVGYLRYDAAQPWPPMETGFAAPGAEWQSDLPRTKFEQRMADVHEAIAAGQLYQVNYTAPLHAEFRGDARAWFMALRRTQPNGYAAFIDSGGEQVLSVSPELFFDWRDDDILARPMKGTAPRGATVADDEALAAQLVASPKKRTVSSCVSRPRGVRITTRSPPSSPVCSTPCCGPGIESSPSARAAMWPYFWMGAGSRRRCTAVCWVGRAGPLPARRAACRSRGAGG